MSFEPWSQSSVVAPVSWRVRAAVLLVGVVLAGAAAVGFADRPYDRVVLAGLERMQGELVERRAGPVVLPNLAGEMVDLQQFRGRVVMVNFWASWCEPCRDELPSMVTLANQMADRPFVMVAISLDEDVGAMQALLQETGVPGSPIVVLHDPAGATSTAWGTRLLPETWIVDPDGVVVARYAGPRAWDAAEVRTVLERVATRRWRLQGA